MWSLPYTFQRNNPHGQVMQVVHHATVLIFIVASVVHLPASSNTCRTLSAALPKETFVVRALKIVQWCKLRLLEFSPLQLSPRE